MLWELISRDRDFDLYWYCIKQINIQGGNEVANNIVDRWKVTYKRRMAMMEEFDML